MPTIRGTIRHIDELGRITLPSEMRKLHNLNACDPVEIFATDEGFILKTEKSSGKIITDDDKEFILMGLGHLAQTERVKSIQTKLKNL